MISASGSSLLALIAHASKGGIEPAKLELVAMMAVRRDELLDRAAEVRGGRGEGTPCVAGTDRCGFKRLRRPDYRNPGSLVSSAHRLPCTLGSRRSQTSTTWAKLRRTICWPAYICNWHRAYKYEGYLLNRAAVYLPHGYSGRPLLLNSRSAEFVEFVADGEVALAGGCLQAVAVHDGDAAAAVADESGLLEGTGAVGDRGAADAEHLGEEVLGDLEAVRADPVMGLCQPSRGALLGGVQPVTGEILGEEGQHGVGVAM